MAKHLGPVMLDLMGHELSQEEEELLKHPLVGGVILFTRNYHDIPQLSALCRAIRNAREMPLLITVDQEGGRVQRFREGFTRIPPMGQIGEMYTRLPDKALEIAQACGWLLAAELSSVGIDFSFAPVLDLYDKNNPVIGDRAFHSRIDYVISLAKALIRGIHEIGMPAVGKHFPGHGSVNIDSHLTLPIDQRQFDEIYSHDMQPFIALAETDLEGMMPAHIIFQKVDHHPVGFSEYWLKEILRKKCNFPGMIFSDDLNMSAADIIGNHEERVLSALHAGCDMTLICNNRRAVLNILDHLPQKYFIDDERVKRLQGKFTHSFEHLKNMRDWQDKHKQLMRMAEVEY